MAARHVPASAPAVSMNRLLERYTDSGVISDDGILFISPSGRLRADQVEHQRTSEPPISILTLYPLIGGWKFLTGSTLGNTSVSSNPAIRQPHYIAPLPGINRA